MSATAQTSGSLTIPEDFRPGFEYRPFVKRPGFGKRGRTAQVTVNSYRVRAFPNSSIYQYDVQITGKGAERRATLRKVWYSKGLQSKLLRRSDPHAIIYDGNRLAWSIVELIFGEELNVIIDLNEELDPGRKAHADNQFRVRMRKTRNVPLQSLEAYVTGKLQMEKSVLMGFNFMDHLLRETPAKRFVTIKRSFFKHAGHQRLDGGVEAWKGIFQALRPAQGGFLTVNVDVAAAVFWTEGSLVTCLQQLLKIATPNDFVQRLSGKQGRNDLRRIKRVQFYTKHRGAPGERDKRFTVEGFTEKGARDEFFDVRERGTENVSRISIETYYHKTYNIRLRFPTLPLIKTKKKNALFPMELAYVVEGQRYPYKLDERQTSDMIRFTVQRPNIRLETINKNVAELNWKEDPCLQKYGMAIEPTMITTQARILQAPVISYGPGSTEMNFTPQNGRWDLRGKKFARVTTLKSWAIGIAAQPRRVPMEMVQNFVRQFIMSFVGHGGEVVNKQPPIVYLDPGKEMGDSVREVFVAAGNKAQHRPQILFFILTAKAAHPYNDIKAACDTGVGVVSQCLQSKHVEQAKAQYCSNVCMKVNAKLGGTTVTLDKNSHPFYGQEPTIYIGADVSHGGSFGGGGMKAASFASMVGSTDKPGYRYSAVCNTNGIRVENITTPNVMRFIPLLLRNYRKNTGDIPRRIFYFRDGVSEGEYVKVLDEEINDIKRACKALDPGWNPKLTVIICTKRHHSRFFPRDKHASDKNGNVVPGTVIERDITHVTDFDFYLCSHAAIQGTSRATRYTVIMDDNKLAPDVIQALIYNFCYTYMRATNAVSLVPPVYYAHLASARARAHEIGGAERDAERMRDTTPSGSRAREESIPIVSENIIPIHNTIHDSMWFI